MVKMEKGLTGQLLMPLLQPPKIRWKDGMGDHMPQHPILRLGPGLHSRGMRALDAPLSELQELSLRIIKTPLRQVRVGRWVKNWNL